MQLKRALQGELQASEASDLKALESLEGVGKVHRRANTDWVRKLDHMLVKGTGTALDRFLPLRRLGALLAGDQRYFQMVSTMGEAAGRRSCLSLGAGGAKWELPRKVVGGEAFTPALHISAD